MVSVAGIFVTLEGIDGCGKTTQARLLASWLEERGLDVLLTREPGGTETGGQIRSLVLSPDRAVTPEAELFLYLADRALHVSEVIRPALARGKTVLCERYTDSTLAYQGHGRGLDPELLRRLNDLATQETVPDLTLVLDVPPEQARLDGASLDRLESEDSCFRARVADGFRALARAEPGRVKLVDGRPGVEVVHKAILKLVEGLLREKGAAPSAGWPRREPA